jgi:two-component system cell cycle sensor histidine kinase/response regulator CckA
VIINLSVNARDAMPDGGHLTIESTSIELADAGDGLSPGNYVALVISDTGCGIAPEQLPRIFEPFFTTKPAGMGTGLGLSTVFGIVAQSKGSIRAESEVGVGTRFTILFPAVSQVAQQAVREDDVAPMGSETVLVVEDAAGVRTILHRTLETLGYQVLLAEDARQAMEVFQREQVDVVLTDVVMPSVTGVELVRGLRELKPSLKVLYMSGYTDLEVLRTGVYDSGDTLLQKPFSRKALASALRALLDDGASDSPTAAA